VISQLKQLEERLLSIGPRLLKLTKQIRDLHRKVSMGNFYLRFIQVFGEQKKRGAVDFLKTLIRLVVPSGSVLDELIIKPLNFRRKKRSSIYLPGVILGPLKYVPRDGGLFSVFNFMVSEMYLGRKVYPLFSIEEIKKANKKNGPIVHFAYLSKNCSNSWFEFFEPIEYFPGDDTHLKTFELADLPSSSGELGAPEFRWPSASLKLYTRPDFADWRLSVNRVVANKIKLKKNLKMEVEKILEGMSGRRIGVHIRHPSHFVEQGNVFFETYFSKIDKLIEKYPTYSIFLATDNELAIAAFIKKYGHQNLHYYPDFIRESIDDVLRWAYSLSRGKSDEMGLVEGVGFQTHYKLAASGFGERGIQAGREAVIDVFTLIGCDDFVCTVSNFTLTSSFMNPSLDLHLVSAGA